MPTEQEGGPPANGRRLTARLNAELTTLIKGADKKRKGRSVENGEVPDVRKASEVGPKKRSEESRKKRPPQRRPSSGFTDPGGRAKIAGGRGTKEKERERV